VARLTASTSKSIRTWLLFGLSVIAIGCAARRSSPPAVPTLAIEQASLRMVLPVDPDGTIQLARQTPFLGFVDIAPILEAEGTTVETVQVISHLGRYVIVADRFRSLWVLTPRPGTTRAEYRAVPVSEAPMSGTRLSRYGASSHGACVRIDATGVEPKFLSATGELLDACD